MTIREVLSILNEWAPLANAEGFDNVGLLVGNEREEVTNIMVAHDALEAVVLEAAQKSCNLIVCFHPIIFSGLKQLTGKTYVERAVIQAIKHDIAIFAIHTALDNVPHGVNYGMSNALGLTNCKVLIPKEEQLFKLTTYVPHAASLKVANAVFKAGAGQLGNYSECHFETEGIGTFRPEENAQPAVGSIGQRHHEPEKQLHFVFEKDKRHPIIAALKNAHPYEEVAFEITALVNSHPTLGMGQIGSLEKPMSPKAFLAHTKQVFDTGGIRHSKIGDTPIKKVAVLGGSGAFAIAAAKRAGADAYVTADLKYHDFYQAEDRLLLADIGHYESERFTKNIITNYLTEKIRNFAIILSEENTNPINYF